MKTTRIRLRFWAFDHKTLDSAVSDIVVSVRKTGARVKGPIPLPMRIRKSTLLISPHVDKDAREQFEIRTHKRMLDILDPSEDTMNTLRELELSSGVEVQIQVGEG